MNRPKDPPHKATFWELFVLIAVLLVWAYTSI